MNTSAKRASLARRPLPYSARLRGKPVAVGNGVVASPSYEARALGVTTAMPIHQALRICPQLVVLDGRHDVYRCFTEATWEICRRYAPALETLRQAVSEGAASAHRCRTRISWRVISSCSSR